MVESQAGDWPISSGGEGAAMCVKCQRLADHANRFRRKLPKSLWRTSPSVEKPNEIRLRNGYQKLGTVVAFNVSRRDDTGEKSGDGTMRYFDEQDRRAASNGFSRFGRWLGTRKVESWGFFIAGFILARIIF
jgi:hypothetical protein